MKSLIQLLMSALFLLGVGSPLLSQGFKVLGPSSVDVSFCSSGGPTGKTESIIWIERQTPNISPAIIKLLNAPPDISVSFSPSTLTFPGGAIAEPVTITFEIIPGTAIPDVILNLFVVDEMGKNLRFDMLLFGTCPRHNNDFIIRGSFVSVQANKSFPVEGAIVEIYRDVQFFDDHHVGSTTTNKLGQYEVRLWADDVDTYFAKLRLNDGAGVYMRDWWNSEIIDYNSFNRGENDQPVIELGVTIISRDDGKGTPKSAVWQGGRAAFQEFIQVTGVAPPTGDYEIVNQNSGLAPWTARSTTNYEEGTPTFDFQKGNPIPPSDISHFDSYFSQFISYTANFHEFGHALRHTVDGNQAHFLNDAARWTYARKHTICGSDPGYIEVEGFGFNEGWANFWELDPPSMLQLCGTPFDLTNMTNEGAVMNDIYVVAEAIEQCFPVSPIHAQRVQAQRRNMWNVINRGENIIHSQGEFRSNAAQQFPGCALPGVGSVGTANSPLLISNGTPMEARSSILELFRERLVYYQNFRLELEKNLVDSQEEMVAWKDCNNLPCEEFALRLIRPVILKGQIKYVDLVQDVLMSRYKEVKNGYTTMQLYSARKESKSEKQLDKFDKTLLGLANKSLCRSILVLKKHDKKASSSGFCDIVRDLNRKQATLKLNHASNNELYEFFEIPLPPNGDKVSAKVEYENVKSDPTQGKGE